MKQFFGKKSRSALATVLLVSLILHVMAVIVFGTIKLVTDAIREETVFETAPIEVAPQIEPEYKVNLQQRVQDTPPPRPPAIVVNNPSELDIPTLDIDVNVETVATYGRGGGGFGEGLSGIRDMEISADLFGMEVVGKLGVVFDISPSTHDSILEVIDQLERNFADAPIVCASCAGFNGAKGKVVTFKTCENGDYFQAQWSKATRLRGEDLVRNIRAALRKRENVYAVVNDTKENNKGKGPPSNLTEAVNYLVEKERVREIYIFSDFADGSDEKVTEKLVEKLKAKQIKLNALVVGSRKLPFLVEMCRQTGGSHQFFADLQKKR